MLERNWKDRAYQEERSREKARMDIKKEIEDSKPKKTKGISGYIAYAAIGVIVIVYMHHFGIYLGLSITSLFDKTFIAIILILCGLFYASMKEWI